MDVSIIIVNYKTKDLVASCVQSIISNSKGFSFEIIIVDNSVDSTEFDFLLKIKNSFPNLIKLLNPKKNLGFGKANNLGVSIATGDYYYFFNSDALLQNNAILILLDYSKKLDSKIVSPNIYTGEGKPAHSFIRQKFGLLIPNFFCDLIHTISRILFHKRNDFNYSKMPKRIKGFSTGAALLVGKKAFQTIGGFDEDIFMYGEDLLFCQQAIKKKIRIFNIPFAKVIHLEGASDHSTFSTFKITNYVHGNYISRLKLLGKKKAKLYLLSSFFACLLSSFYYKLIKKPIASRNKRLLAKQFLFEKKLH